MTKERIKELLQIVGDSNAVLAKVMPVVHKYENALKDALNEICAVYHGVKVGDEVKTTRQVRVPRINVGTRVYVVKVEIDPHEPLNKPRLLIRYRTPHKDWSQKRVNIGINWEPINEQRAGTESQAESSERGTGATSAVRENP